MNYGDRDPGEIENYPGVPNVWHPSFLPGAQLPPPAPKTAAGAAALQSVKSLIQPPRKPLPARQSRAGLSGAWKATPEAFRRLVARSAGLAEDVVGKVDRELTESEKAHIRAAAARLKERAEGLFAI